MALSKVCFMAHQFRKILLKSDSIFHNKIANKWAGGHQSHYENNPEDYLKCDVLGDKCIARACLGLDVTANADRMCSNTPGGALTATN